MTLSQATLIQRVRYHLGDFPWETTGAAASGSSTVTVEDGSDWSEGQIGEFATDGDTFRVNSIEGGYDGNVLRSYAGSTGAAHTAGSRILRDPKFRYLEITNAISQVIEFMLPWPRIYKVTADTITPDPTNKAWYDLAADALALVSVKQLYSTSDRSVQVYGPRHGQPRVSFQRGLPTSLVASGVGVAFPDGFRHATNTVNINYAAKITDTIATAAYADFSAGEAVTSAIEYGAVALLQGTLELRRPRESAEDTDPLRGYSLFGRLFMKAMFNAEKELRQRSPLMHGWDAS